jgi:hypothetical protein
MKFPAKAEPSDGADQCTGCYVVRHWWTWSQYPDAPIEYQESRWSRNLIPSRMRKCQTYNMLLRMNWGKGINEVVRLFRTYPHLKQLATDPLTGEKITVSRNGVRTACLRFFE